jgi:hypothetical protein
MAKQPSPQPTNAVNGKFADQGVDNAESLDQVRDILFGGQMRTVETRLRSLEQRILDEQEHIRAEFQRRMTELDVTIKREFAAHADRLKEERMKRAEDMKSLAADLNEARKSLDRRQQQLEEATGMADAELRDQLLAQGALLSADMAKTAQKISAELERSTSALRADKVDTALLAAALGEMATRLTNGTDGAKQAKPNKGST